MSLTSSSIVEQVNWLESVLHEVDMQSGELWRGPYADMNKLGVVFETYMLAVERYLPNGLKTAPAPSTRQLVADLAHVSEQAKKNKELASYWMAVLLSSFLTLKDMKESMPSCPVTMHLYGQCADMLKKAEKFPKI